MEKTSIEEKIKQARKQLLKLEIISWIGAVLGAFGLHVVLTDSEINKAIGYGAIGIGVVIMVLPIIKKLPLSQRIRELEKNKQNLSS